MLNRNVTKVKCAVSKGDSAQFSNKVDFCIGTGRMGLALQKEYFEQLKYVQEIIDFEFIRGHGLFSDDMAIYHEYEDENGEIKSEYNFTYLDLVMDSYKEVGIKPFLELGFMPDKLSSGEQTVFYWKGNVTPPKSYEKWCDLVVATLSHLMERYGVEEVIGWPIEVWNEPNLPGFWKDADREEYFKLFKVTFNAIKNLDKRFRVGGPAICGVNDEEWIREFMEFCKREKLYPDFITRHHYTTELPEKVGHYGYQKLSAPEYGRANLHTTREIIDSYDEYKGLEIHLTEFNTSYIPNNPIHDTNQNAAFLANQLSWLGDDNASYSYWTFGDIFEEIGVPYTPFHGGFGLVANGVIPKPTFWTFAFYKQIKRMDCIFRSDEAVVVTDNDKKYSGIVWNHGQTRTGRVVNFYCDIYIPDAVDGDEYFVVYKTVDEKSCNPLKVWHDMGEPASLSESQKSILKEASKPVVTTDVLTVSDGKINVKLTLDEFAVVYFECIKINRTSDRGYSYERVVKGNG